MSKISGYHEGDRCESLVAGAMGTIGFCTQVPRPSDFFLTDFFVHLFAWKERVLHPTGLVFALQAKANFDEILIAGEDERRCFFRSLIPFFVAVYEKAKGVMSVYTTCNRLHLALTPAERNLRLRFGGECLQPPTEDGVMWLGDPIARVAVSDLDSSDPDTKRSTREGFLTVMAQWTFHEAKVLAWRHSGSPLLSLPKRYKVNESLNMTDLDFCPVLYRENVDAALNVLCLHLVGGAAVIRPLAESLSLTPSERDTLDHVVARGGELMAVATALQRNLPPREGA